MWRTTIVIIIALVIILFAGGNMHTTRVNLPFANGFEIRTILLLFVSFVLGYGTAYFVGFIKNSKNNQK